MKAIKNNYYQLRRKSTKTISNMFASYETLVLKHTLLRIKNPENDSRYWEVDPKGDSDYFTKDYKIVEKLEEIYHNYIQFLIKPNDKNMNKTIYMCKKLTKFIISKNPDNKYITKDFLRDL